MCINKLKFYGFFLVLVLFLFSCSKDRIETNNEDKTLNSYESMNDYFDTKKQEEQEFIIDSGGSGPIVGNQGTKIWVSKDLLMYPNGDSVDWPYIVKLVELYTPKDMIYYQMPNVSDGNLLTCHGEIRLRAFKNGQELVLRPSCVWPVQMPNTQPADSMNIYYGDELPSYVNWIDTPTGSFDTISYGYQGNVAVLGWVACARSAGTFASQTAYQFTSSVDNLDNVATFIYFDDKQSLTQVYNQQSIDLPIGQNAKIILMAIDANQQLHHYYLEEVISNSNVKDIELQPVSDIDLTTILDNL